MNTIIGELGKNSKFCDYIKNIEGKIVSDSKINTNGLGNKKISFI